MMCEKKNVIQFVSTNATKVYVESIDGINKYRNHYVASTFVSYRTKQAMYFDFHTFFRKLSETENSF